jgi:hypothetical protein
VRRLANAAALSAPERRFRGPLRRERLQLEWQRGFWNTELLYRWFFVFGGPLSLSYFERKTGVSIPDFALYGICIHGLFEEQPGWMERGLLDLPMFNHGIAEGALKLLSTPLEAARQNARRLKRDAQTTSYQPSQYRQTPLISIGDPPRLRAPLRDLIQVRITSGLFYDLADGPDLVRNEIGDRFEQYSYDLLADALPSLQVSRTVPYRFKGNPMDTPDVILRDSDRVAAVFECKARRMSFAARYAEDQVADGGGGFDELIRGICQIWRFFAHIRLGCMGGFVIDDATSGVLLTLDNWVTMSSELQRELVQLASERAAKRHPEIIPGDQRRIVFCSIEELEQTLAGADGAQFIADLKLPAEDRYLGWILPNVHRDVAGREGTTRPYPFAGRLNQVLPWWDNIVSLAEATVAKASTGATGERG